MVERLPVSASYPNPPPREKDKKLFERIFDIKALFNDPIDSNSFEFHHFSFNTNQQDDTGVDPKMPLLLSGLGITEAELVLLFRLLNKQVEFNPDGNCRLDRLKISLLYRHVRLARGLKFASINDFVTALSVQSEPDFIIDNNTQNKQRSIIRILQIIDFRDWLINSPFDVNELALILFGQENSSTRFSTTKETVIAIIHEIQNSKEIEDDKTEALKDAISALFGISLKHLEKILLWLKTDIKSPEIQNVLKTPTDLDSSPIPSDGLEKLIELIHEIERILLIFSKLKFTETTVVKITDKPLHVGIENLKKLTLENLQSLTIYYKVLDSMIEEEEKRDSDENIGKLLEDYLVNPNHKLSKENIDFLLTIWKKNGDTLDSISKSIAFPSDSNSTPIEKVYYLWKLSEICKTLGINGSLLVKIGDDAGFKELSEARDIILGIFSSKYEDEKLRQEKLGPYQDKINKRETDILSDYIICLNKELRFKNYNDLFSFFLLDPEMGSCARTSRLASAISSLQLYVHRCLINLEQSDPALSPTIPKVHVDPSIIPQDQWAWRKNLVLWRGNREIFLYPENYLEPDLRDNKTPLFKELEEELFQQNITKESVETSYRKYVSQFAELARLIISGAYYHSETKTYYLFGRTAGDPWQYYYRECIDNKIWKPWKKVDVRINCNRISAIINRGRLYIFWHDKSRTSAATVKNGGAEGTPIHTKYLVFSSMDEYGKWSPPQKFAFEPFPGSVPTNPNGSQNLDDLNSMIYPYIKKENTKEEIYALSFSSNMGKTFVYKIDLFKNNLIAMPRADEASFVLIPSQTKLIGISGYFNASQQPPVQNSWLGIDTGMNLPSLQRTEPRIAFMMTHDSGGPENTRLTNALVEPTSTFLYHFDPEIQLVGSKPGDSIIKLRGQQYLIIYDPEFEPGPSPVNPFGPSLKTSQLFFDTFQTHSYLQHNNPGGGGIVKGDGAGKRSNSTNHSFMNTSSLSLYSKPFVVVSSSNNLFNGLLLESRRPMIRISTSLHDTLGQILFSEGIEKFLSLETQKLHEQPLDILFRNPSELHPPGDNTVDNINIDFDGAYGEYYRELFLHIPF